MKTFLKVTLVLSAFSALGGCIAVPAGPGYYPGGGYYDLRRYGDPNSRDALDTCSYC